MKRAMLLLWLVGAATFAAWVVGPFLAAGTWRWPTGWLYGAFTVAGALAHGRYVRAKNPGLRERRRRIGEGTPAWDLVWNALIWPLFASAPIAAGFASRAGTPEGPVWLVPLGASVLAAGFAVSAWAMSVNPFFETTARVQSDHDQRVVEMGPYRLIRHPGYLGLCLWASSAPALLRSTWALPFALALVGWIVLRTDLEDALLRHGLAGYAAYSTKVRYRLFPGLW